MKTINEYKIPYEKHDVGYMIESAFLAGYFCARYESQINEFNATEHTGRLEVDSDGIYLKGGKRADILSFLKIFGGRWNKTPNDYYKDKIDYRQKIETPFDGNYKEFFIAATEAEPPPSCVIEEYEELVPAQMVKKKRMVCPKPDNDEATQVAEVTEVASQEAEPV